MKEQARLREEMNYQYRLGNFQVRSFVLNLQARYDGLTYTPITLSKSFFYQAAAAIQKRLDPDAPLQ